MRIKSKFKLGDAVILTCVPGAAALAVFARGRAIAAPAKPSVLQESVEAAVLAARALQPAW